MKRINVNQGSEAWKELRKDFFTASEAPMMMGDHKNISRNQLLDAKKGWTTIVDEYLQKLFDKGHATEEAARPLAADDVGEDLFPITGSLEVEGLPLLASFDGLTMFDDVCFEHKLFNKTLAENVLNNVLEPHYYWQLEQQLLVSGADKCYFVTSDGTKDNWKAMYYESIPERRKALIKGWKQFAIDLENHEPQAKVEKVQSDPVRELPAIQYRMEGLTLHSNLEAYKAAANELVEKSKVPLETDQHFADAEARQKIFKKAEDDIKLACDRVLGEIGSIDEFVKDMRFISENIRQARLAEGKQIKSRKDEIRYEIGLEAENKVKAHLEIFRSLAVIPPVPSISIIEAMKGKKTIQSLRDAAETAVSQIKIELDGLFHVANGNAEFMKDYAEFRFLFMDWKDIAFKSPEDFQALVKVRIAEHKEREAQREAEIKAKAEAEAKAKIEAEEAAKAKAEAEAKPEPEVKPTPTQTVKSEKPATYLAMPGEKPKQQSKPAQYEPLAIWPSDVDRAENETLDEVCQKLEQAEDYIQFLERQIGLSEVA